MDHPRVDTGGKVGPVDAARTPRYAGFGTFARLPRIEDVSKADVAVVGMPFDTGVSYRPGARFGATHVRESSRLLRPFNPAQSVSPFAELQMVDAGDVALNAFDIQEAMRMAEEAAAELLRQDIRLATIGGDHTLALPMLRAHAKKHGPVALLHFDAHLDTWDTYFGAEYTHGTPFRRAFEEGLIDTDALCHVGTRGPLYGTQDLEDDARFGFGIVTSNDVMRMGVDEVVGLLRERVGDRPLYISLDIDVLDPAHAPGTGTPEPGGMTSRELLEILRAACAARTSSAPMSSRSRRPTTTPNSPGSRPLTSCTSSCRCSPSGQAHPPVAPPTASRGPSTAPDASRHTKGAPTVAVGAPFVVRGQRGIATYFVSRYSSMPSKPPSRP